MRSTLRWSLLIGWMLRASTVSDAQIIVHPNGVNVNAQGATTVFLTFGGLNGVFQPAEAFWCGELIAATPDLGMKCNPATLFGRLPVRYDQSRLSGSGGFTDIMSIPASVARRAWQAAESGANSAFYYVRRFVSSSGAGPDVYVFVTCRMAGGGARVPLALTDVRLGFAVELPVLYLAPGDTVAPIAAELSYTGTGRLKGRWEVVRPGEELPESQDLLTEASLPRELRGTQRRYTEVARFNVFLPPSGRYTLAGPPEARLPTAAEGTYLVLLRIEASDDKEGDSSLEAVGAGQGIVHSGAVAGFALPTLRYHVGAGSSGFAELRAGPLELLAPADAAAIDSAALVEFRWRELAGAAFYRLEIETVDGETVMSAVVPRGTVAYQTPPWLLERAGGKDLRWRVRVLGREGEQLRRSTWRRLEVRR